ncbi:hypothetical protein AB1Y20_007568 [Prymnesium parvum]|uniref:SIR2-like domain-containing protein n=1 Tax=Prymnesium parvum TaxID=97485 RepID=A0AB34IY57_PRYPA
MRAAAPLLVLLCAPAPASTAAKAAPQSCGHIFVLNTDLRYLACDVWLCPVDFSCKPDTSRWRITAEELPPRPEGWGQSVHAVRCMPRTAGEQRARRQERHRRYDHPQPILALARSEGGDDQLSTRDRTAALREFLSLAREELQGERARCRFGRRFPLIALPIIGSGLAANDVHGAADSGEILVEMLQELHEFTRRHHVDVALCTVDESAYGAALLARRQLLGDLSPDRLGRLWRLHPPDDVADVEAFNHEVDRLADAFLYRQVSLFLGAGVSINAGLPSWKQLLDILATDLDLPDDHRAALSLLNPLEAASVLAARAGGEAVLKQRCAAIIGAAKRHSLMHGLLAGLPFKGCITTNFDELFELAVIGAGAEMAVLPADIGTVRDRWCLKLHGSVSRPSSIVLTRSDYTRYSAEQAASEGVLQGILMTQHVLFVGFSMRDENWCRIVEKVRGSFREVVALPEDVAGRDAPPDAKRAELPRVGTMLPLERDPLFDSLWEQILHVTPINVLHVAPGDAAPGPAPRGQEMTSRWSHVETHARQLEILLDHVASAVESRRCRILLNPKYEKLLSPRSKELSDAIFAFLNALSEEVKHSGPFRQVLKLLLRLGLRTDTVRQLTGDDTVEGPYRQRLQKVVLRDAAQPES